LSIIKLKVHNNKNMPCNNVELDWRDKSSSLLQTHNNKNMLCDNMITLD
jgi:hypothetical protein